MKKEQSLNIDLNLVKKIAKLARLEFKEEELSNFALEFQQILSFVSQILRESSVGHFTISRVQPFSNLREDEEGDSSTERELLLEQFLEREGDYLKIRKILEK